MGAPVVIPTKAEVEAREPMWRAEVRDVMNLILKAKPKETSGKPQ